MPPQVKKPPHDETPPQVKTPQVNAPPQGKTSQVKMPPPPKFHFSKELLHLRQRGIEIHSHLPDNCPLDSDGLPTFQWSINHFIPDETDKHAILKFMGLNDFAIQQVLNLYENDTESHDKHGEAVFDGYKYRFPLTTRLLDLYAGMDFKGAPYELTYGTICLFLFSSSCPADHSPTRWLYPCGYPNCWT